MVKPLALLLAAIFKTKFQLVWLMAGKKEFVFSNKFNSISELIEYVKWFENRRTGNFLNLNLEYFKIKLN